MTSDRKTVTMADVAREAGVSPMTVSRALKDNPAVRSATRASVAAAAERLGYVVDCSAAALSSGKTGVIGVVVPAIEDGLIARTVRALADGLTTASLSPILGQTGYDPKAEDALIEQFLGHRPEAIVLTGDRHSEKARRLLDCYGQPAVELYALPEQPIGDVVGYCARRAAQAIVEHVVEMGYSRPGLVDREGLDDPLGLDLRAQVVEALESAGLEGHRSIACDRSYPPMRAGANAMRELLARHADVDVVLCFSDMAALGALRVALAAGKHVPDELGMVGFGGYESSAIATPSITTVDIRAEEIGERAAGFLWDRLRGGRETPRAHKVEPRLIARQSTRRAAA